MITPTRIEVRKFAGESGDRTQQWLECYFSLPMVLAGATSDTIRFLFSPYVYFHALKVSCNSVDYDLSFRNRNGITVPSVHEIFKVTNINLSHYDNDVRVPSINSDSPQEGYLYLVITNTDAVHPTGLIQIQITISQL